MLALFEDCKNFEYASLPTLLHRPEFVGSTDYIDRLPVDAVSAPVMKSCDQYRRPYVTFRLSVHEGKEAKYDDVIVLFQRYTDSETPLCFAGSCIRGRLPSLILNSETKQLWRDLLNGKTVCLQQATIKLC